MRAILLLGCTALALGACNQAEEADVNAADNMILEENAAVDAGGMDANLATNAATENAMVNDLLQNDADTNLANGM